MLQLNVGSLSSGASLPVHEYPAVPVAHVETVGSWAQVVGRSGTTTMVPPAAQQYVPAAVAATQSPSVASGVAEPVQLNPVSVPLQVTDESELQVSTVAETLAEQPAPPSKSERSPKETNQEIRMRVRLPALMRAQANLFLGT
jgi:hypothetical protein